MCERCTLEEETTEQFRIERNQNGIYGLDTLGWKIVFKFSRKPQAI